MANKKVWELVELADAIGADIIPIGDDIAGVPLLKFIQIVNLLATIKNPIIITSADAAALLVGPNGATNPVLKINASIASQDTGIEVVPTTAAGAVSIGSAIRPISSQASVSLTLEGMSNGAIIFRYASGIGNDFARFSGSLGGFRLSKQTGIFWSSVTSDSAAALDAGIERVVPFVVGINNGNTGTFAWLRKAGHQRVATQFDKTDVTLANIPGLSETLIAGRTYAFEAELFIDADATGGSKYAVGGTCTASAIIYQIELLDNSTNVHTIVDRQTALGGNSGQAGTTVGKCKITGTITVNTGGTLTIQFAQNAANGTSSVLIGSKLSIEDIT